MPEITINMTPENASRINNAFQGLWPIPLNEENGTPLYTPAQWGRVQIIRMIRQSVRRWENKIAQDAAAIQEDPNIAT